MPKSCCIHGCTSNKNKNPEKKFFIIPTEKIRRKQWLDAINRAKLNEDGTVDKSKRWSPQSNHCYVCSDHFISGEKVNDPLHPDYVPSLFPHKENAVDKTSTSTGKIDRLNRARKRSHSAVQTPELKARKKLKLVTPNKDPALEVTTVIDVAEEPAHIPTGHVTLETPLELEKKLTASALSAASVEGNDELCRKMTGLSWAVFTKLFLYLSTFVPQRSASSTGLSLQDQLFITLVKLRHNISFEVLAHIKGVSKTSIIEYFWKWVDLMHFKIRYLIRWTDRDSIFKNIPSVFKSKFPKLTSIIDCFEIFIEAPKNLLARAQCYSQYKKHCTVKVFISCTPLGNINFVSKAWGGRASDIQIVRESGFIDPKFHHPGDQILADRGFTLHNDFAACCSASLLTPAFTKGKKQLSAREVETSRKISSVRIHIERIIGLMKNRFTILKGPLPIRCVQSLKDESLNTVLSSCDKIVQVCAALTNLGSSIVFKE